MKPQILFAFAVFAWIPLLGCEPGPPAPAPSVTTEEAALVADEPTRFEAPIDREATARHPRFDASLLAEAQRATLSRTTVPVLLVEEPSLVAAALVTADVRWYAASMRLSDHTVYVSGTRDAFDEPDHVFGQGPDHFETAEIGRIDGIAEVGFTAFGAAYELHVECDAPFEDARCAGDDYIEWLLDRLFAVDPEVLR